MRIFKQLMLIAIFTVGLALSVSAQNQDNENKRPPKERPDIRVEDKNQPKPPSNDNRNDRPKKPQAEIAELRNRE